MKRQQNHIMETCVSTMCVALTVEYFIKEQQCHSVFSGYYSRMGIVLHIITLIAWAKEKLAVDLNKMPLFL